MAWTYEWTSGYTNFTESEKYENARLLWNGLEANGWTAEAIAGAIGNFEYESGGQFNLGQWQHGYSVGDWDNAGLGLGQWTPASKLADYCGGRTEAACCDGDKQCAFIATNAGQWDTRYVTPSGYSKYYGYSGIPYYATLAEYAADSTKTPEAMCLSFACIWERGNNEKIRESMQTRQRNARRWYEEFSGGSGTNRFAIRLHAQGNCAPYATLHLNDTTPIYSAEAGTDIFIHANVGQGDYFLMWTSDYGGANIDVETSANTFFTMPSSIVDITAHATGSTPEPPPVPPPPTILKFKRHKMPIWMYPCLRG